MKTRREYGLMAYSWFSGCVSGAVLLALVEVIFRGVWV